MRTLPPAIWLDDSHPVVRRGMAASLEGAGFRVEGESASLSPDPPVPDLDVLVFQADDGNVARVVHYAADTDVALVALFHKAPDTLLPETIRHRLAAALSFSDLTPASFVATVWSAAQGTVTVSDEVVPTPRQGTSTGRDGERLSVRELEVLTLLAEGESTRGVANRLAFSERTVKNLVHDLLMKLNCRNRPHAVAQAIRQGLI